MEESEMDEYNLNSSERQQSLKISLINNELISMILTNKITKQKYSTFISLEGLNKLSKAFISSKTIKDALIIIKNTIESGKIVLEEDPKEKTIEITLNISLASGNYPPFNIKLYSQENLSEYKIKEKENMNDFDIQELPATFDYQGNKELENRYGNITSNTTEYIKPIFKADVKPPIKQFEYIEPILQVHYPDGSIKSKELPPRIQEINGQTPVITEEQFKAIREQMNKNTNSHIKHFSPIKDYSNNFRAISQPKQTNSSYSTHTMSYYNNYNTDIFKNLVRPAMKTNQTNILENNIKTLNNTNNNNNYNYNFNNNFDKSFSYYSNSTHKPSLTEVYNYNFQNNNLQMENNHLNKTNYINHSNTLNKNINFNNIIERRPRMINMKKDFNSNSNINRSLSTPHNLEHFNPNKVNYNLYNYTQTNNQYITQNQMVNQINNNLDYPLDRKTPRPVLNINNNTALNSNINNYLYSNNKNQMNNIQKIKQNYIPSIQVQQKQIEDRLSLIKKQQEKLQVFQQQLAKIQEHQQQIQNHQKNLRLSFKNQNQNQNIQTNNNINNNNKYPPKEFVKVELIEKKIIRKPYNNLLREQIKIEPNKPPIRHVLSNSVRNNLQSNLGEQQYFHQSSHEIWQNKKQILSQSNNPEIKKQISTPITSQAPILKREISQQQITLAQMASMENQENPSHQNMEAIILPNINQESIVEQDQNIQYNQYNEEIKDEYQQEQVEQQKEEEQVYQKEEPQVEQIQKEGDSSVETLFITEEGKVIFRNGLLRGIIHKYSEIDEVVSKIQDILLKGVKFNLVYKAFDLDDKAETFHNKCDNLEMSLVLIETDEDIRFGGFTTKSWKGNCIKKIDNDSFVFNLDVNKIYDVIENQYAVGCYPKFGPVFFGCQIRIFDEFFKNGGTTCHAGLNFKTDNDFELNNGKQKFLVKDIEVYSLETIKID